MVVYMAQSTGHFVYAIHGPGCQKKNNKKTSQVRQGEGRLKRSGRTITRSFVSRASTIIEAESSRYIILFFRSREKPGDTGMMSHGEVGGTESVEKELAPAYHLVALYFNCSC